MRSRARLGIGVAAVALMAGTATAATNYVWSGGTHTAPYDTWTAAATNIQTAVDYASTNYPAYDTVLVTNGTYNITNQIDITNAITVRSLNGAPVTTVQRTGASEIRIFQLTHAGAVLDGFTIRNGYAVSGAGVYMTAGTVVNCDVRDNLVKDWAPMNGVGICMTGGTVTNCTIRQNSSGLFFNGYGGGVYMTGGLLVKSSVISNELFTNTRGMGIYASGSGVVISHCNISYNKDTRDANAAGVCLEGGATLRNSLVRGNTLACVAATENGGGVYMTGAGTLVESCTIIENTMANGNGGGIYMAGGAVSNSIVYFNSAGVGANYVAGGNGLAYSCATPLPAGTGNTDQDPQFTDRANGDLHVRIGQARDTGFVLPWMSASADLDGHARLDFNGTADMGAYQTQGGALECGLAAIPPSFGIVPLTVAFSSQVQGTNTTGLGYQWDFQNDGTPDAEGPGLATTSHVYTAPGRYSVRLVVTNAAGEIAAFTNLNLVTATLTNLYVATTGTCQVPYTNLATAATNFLDAFDVAGAGARVLVNSGTYSVVRSIDMNRATRITGIQGATNTTLQRSGAMAFRMVSITDSGAVLEGLTLRNGSGQDGAGIYMTNGTVRDCIVRDNIAGTWGQSGGGIYMTGGAVSNCVIRNNYASGGAGGGVYLTGGQLSWSAIITNELFSNQGGGGVAASGAGALVSHCVITNNRGTRDGFAGGVYVGGGARLRNCLVGRNTEAGWTGGGVRMDGAGSLVESCTVVSNTLTRATADGGGIYMNGGAASNSIVYFNSAPTNANYRTGGSGLAYSCTTPLPTGSGNIAGDPQFINGAVDNWRLQRTSPCINNGAVLAWMTDAMDLDSRLRVQGGGADMGIYEVPAAGTVFVVH